MDKNDSVDGSSPGAQKKPKKSVELIEINADLCKGCSICVEFCPTDVFQESNKLSKRGYYVPIVVDIERCPGCRLCELLCPELAIIIEYVKKTTKTEAK